MTKTHWNTPATPGHADPVLSAESATRKPAALAMDPNAITYAKKSHVRALHRSPQGKEKGGCFALLVKDEDTALKRRPTIPGVLCQAMFCPITHGRECI